MTIRALPVSPSRDRPAQFSQEMDAMLAALPDFVSDANALEQSLQLVATTGTSASTLTIGTGTKTLTTQPGKAWVTGAWVYVFCASAVTNLMVGQVTSYNVETGVLQISSQQVDGGGTFSSWVIGLSVPQVAWAKRGVNDDITELTALSSVPSFVQAAISRLGVCAFSVSPSSGAMSISASAGFVAARQTPGGLSTALSVVAVTGSESLTVPSGATLGVGASGVARVAVLALVVGSTVELAVCATSSAVRLDEMGVVSTSAISAASDLSGVVYSAVARAGVVYRVLGYIDVTAQTTPGNWSAGTLQALPPLPLVVSEVNGFAACQVWQEVSRALGVTYYNTTGRTITVMVALNTGSTSGVFFAHLSGVSIQLLGSTTSQFAASVSFAVPPGGSYRITRESGDGGLQGSGWIELR